MTQPDQALEWIHKLASRGCTMNQVELREMFEKPLMELQCDKERLIEDRARFPDRPDDIGSMIAAHIENLKNAAKQHEDDWRRVSIERDLFARDKERLDWLDSVYLADDCHRINRAAIDAAMLSTPATKEEKG